MKRLRGVAVEAAELESTMLMLGHGLDLFYTRLTPSKSFDMVGRGRKECWVVATGGPPEPACASNEHCARDGLGSLATWIPTPSPRRFPCLQVPDDFPYALLVLIVVSLTTATVVLSFLQSKGTMKAKWQ